MEKQAHNYASVEYYMGALDAELDALVTELEAKWQADRSEAEAA